MINFHTFEAVQLSQLKTFLFSPLFIGTFIIIIVLYILRKFWVLKTLLQQEKVFLELTPPALTEKTSYTTQQLFSVLHQLGNQQTLLERILGKKILFSFEIVSTKEQGIRYLIKTNRDESETIQKMVRAYMPYVRVREIDDYLPKEIDLAKIIEFKLKKHFAFPLAKQNVLNEHDPVAYITGMMTKLLPEELIALQIV